MAKRTRLIFVVAIIFLLVLCIALFLQENLFGPQINDAYAKEQMNTFRAVLESNNIQVIEDSNFVGKLEDGGQFVIWVGVVIEPKLSHDNLNLLLQSMKLPENTKAVPYDLDMASTLHFSGVQKEYWGDDTQGLYLVGTELKPPTTFDKRNR